MWAFSEDHENKACSLKSAVITNPRWAAYATASVASALACMSTAEGDIHYSGLINQTFHDTDPSSAVFVQGYFQLDQPGNSLNPVHNLRPNNGAAVFGLYGNAPAVAGFTASSGIGPYLSKLSFGQAISARPFLANGTSMAPAAFGIMGFGSGYGNSQWLAAGIGFVAFRFNNGSGPQYGWARINMDGLRETASL